MELFPKYQIAFSFGKRKEDFMNVNAVKDSRMQTNENESSRDTHRICDLKNIESSFNKQCTCFFLQTIPLTTSSTIVAISTRPMKSSEK